MGESGTKSLARIEDTIHAIGLYRLIGRCLGIWPLECDESGAKIRFLFVNALQFSLIYNLIQEFVNDCVSLANAVDFIGVLGSTTVSLLKISVIRLHQKNMNCLVESVITDWSKSIDNRSLGIMRRYANFARIASIFQVSSAEASVVLVVVTAPPTISGAANQVFSYSNLSTSALRNMPMGTGCSVIDMSILYYFTFYVFRCIQLVIVVTCLMGCDSIFFGISMHLCAQFELLKIVMTRLGRDPGRLQFRSEIADLIDRHNQLVRMVDLLEDIFHLIILGLLISSSLHIGLLGIYILYGLQTGDYIGLVYPFVGISSLLLQIYLYSYAGESLSSHATEIRDAAYDCCWYNFSSRFVRDVMLTIVRTNHEPKITAGRIYRMNNQGFTSYIKTMATFFSVLKLTILG